MSHFIKSTMVVFLVVLLGGCIIPAWVFHRPPLRGQAFPDLQLSLPQDAEEREYLGLAEGASGFRLSEVQADLLIVEVFDMYCRHCQEAAEQVRILHDRIASQRLDHRVKIIGIALGNSEFEANVFKDKYKLEFPVIADPDSSGREHLGRVATPTFYGLGFRSGQITVLKKNSGKFIDDPLDFLEAAMEKAGLHVHRE